MGWPPLLEGVWKKLDRVVILVGLGMAGVVVVASIPFHADAPVPAVKVPLVAAKVQLLMSAKVSVYVNPLWADKLTGV